MVVPAGARLSPAAVDFVKQWQLELESISVDGAHILEQRPEDAGPTWDHESVFPVSFSGAVPRCTACGTQVTSKPSGMTQLNAHHYAVKNHPRIRLRGQIDALHAQVLLVQRQAREFGDEQLCHDLGTLASYCRELLSAEYNERLVAPLELGEWDVEGIHRATHHPEEELGVAHLTIDDDDPLLQHWLNVLRTRTREIEIVAMDVFPSPHHPYGAAICEALNRLSSAFYFLQLQLEVRRR